MLNDKNILVVDDEPDLCNILKFNLENKGYNVDVAFSAEKALEKELNGYSLILLDIMMNKISGLEMMSIMRNDRKIEVPVIFLSAMTSEESIIEGLGIGADDYIRKPFLPSEVVARVNNVIKRYSYRNSEKTPNSGLVLNTQAKQVLIDSIDIELSRTEYEIFVMLYAHPDKVFSRTEILKKVWPHQSYISSRTVDVNTTRIRKKMGAYGVCLATRSGYGYYVDQKKLKQL